MQRTGKYYLRQVEEFLYRWTFELPYSNCHQWIYRFYMLFDLAFVLAEYSEYLSFLKNGVPLE